MAVHRSVSVPSWRLSRSCHVRSFGTLECSIESITRGVDIKSAVTDKAKKCQAARLGKLDGQTGWSSNCGKDRYASSRSLLDEFKARASTHEKNSVLERDTSIEPLGAKQLVDRVMPPDILS